MNFKPIIGIAAAAALASSSAVAQERTLYDPPTVEMRLLDGGMEAADGARLAGVEIRVETGWKTYWRHPGDSGLPPNFDFSGSTNVAEVSVLWPAPTVSHDGYGWVIGYSDEVVFPVLVMPHDPDTPVELALELDYAVCADICVPLYAKDDRLLRDDAPDGVIIEFYRDLVPMVIDVSDSNRGVQAISRVTADELDLVELTVRMDGGSSDPELVVEGAESWQFAVAELVRRSADEATFRFAPDWDLESGTEIVVTGISPTYSFEQRVVVP